MTSSTLGSTPGQLIEPLLAPSSAGVLEGGRPLNPLAVWPGGMGSGSMRPESRPASSRCISKVFQDILPHVAADPGGRGGATSSRDVLAGFGGLCSGFA